MTTDASPPTPSRDNPLEDRDTPIPAPPVKRRPGRPPKTSNLGTSGRGGGTTRKTTRFDSTLTTMTRDDLATRTTRNETPSPSPPSPPQKEPDETDKKLPARNAPPIVETVHDDPTDTDSEMPDLVPDMFTNTPRNLSKTSFASEPDTTDEPQETTKKPGSVNPKTNTVDRLTDPSLTNLPSGQQRLTRLLNIFGFTIEPYTLNILTDIGATDDHAIMDLTSWDVDTLYDVLHENNILKQSLPNPTTRFYYVCNLLTTLKLIRTYFQHHLGLIVDNDGLFAPHIGFETLNTSSPKSSKTYRNIYY